MDMVLGGLAFAALVIGQFAAVIAVHGQRERQVASQGGSKSRDGGSPARTDYHAMLIREGGLT